MSRLNHHSSFPPLTHFNLLQCILYRGSASSFPSPSLFLFSSSLLLLLVPLPFPSRCSLLSSVGSAHEAERERADQEAEEQRSKKGERASPGGPSVQQNVQQLSWNTDKDTPFKKKLLPFFRETFVSRVKGRVSSLKRKNFTSKKGREKNTRCESRVGWEILAEQI